MNQSLRAVWCEDDQPHDPHPYPDFRPGYAHCGGVPRHAGRVLGILRVDSEGVLRLDPPQ